ncbi:hypothetical protein EVJ58_g5407 [Rhodofomes roseus]|uniref:Uncharacterized protein n=1 Tax=Rhodofomes roseus TaxID=34475 RepID=A0A4Y9YE78_9APHY|nr:hypothetical protein EVJ58_g5407 [Rhodofomes roseus]
MADNGKRTTPKTADRAQSAKPPAPRPSAVSTRSNSSALNDRLTVQPFDNEQALDFLAKYSFVPDNVEPNTETLANGLLMLAHRSNSAIVTEGLRAFATYARNITVTDISSKIRESLDGMLATAHEEQRQRLDDLTERCEQASIEMFGSANRVQNEVSKLSKTVEEVSRLHASLEESVEKAGAAVLSAQDQVAHIEHRPVEPATHAEGPTGPRRESYAAAVNQALPTSHASTLATQTLRAKQVLVDGINLNVADGVTLNERDLLEKAKVAIDLMREHGATAPDGVQIKSARIIPNGGVVYEMESPESASPFSGNTCHHGLANACK